MGKRTNPLEQHQSEQRWLHQCVQEVPSIMTEHAVTAPFVFACIMAWRRTALHQDGTLCAESVQTAGRGEPLEVHTHRSITPECCNGASFVLVHSCNSKTDLEQLVRGTDVASRQSTLHCCEHTQCSRCPRCICCTTRLMPLLPAKSLCSISMHPRCL